MNYLKVGKASELEGKDRKIYRILEIFPGFLSWFTLLFLLILSYFQPIWVAYFIIAFDIYWLLLVFFLGIHLIVSYQKVKKSLKIDWKQRCKKLKLREMPGTNKILGPEDIIHLLIFPTYNEGLEVIRPSIQAIVDGSYPSEKIILVFAIEERAGGKSEEKAKIIDQEFAHKFKKLIITKHPDNIVGELKGKGANQTWAAIRAKEDYIDKERIDYDKILVSVFDMDTIIYPDYFYVLTYRFLTAKNPYKASYQPVPVYHNNIWQAPFFARVAASSNTFWQMMQQIRQEKLATYSSHSMPWKTLVEIGFWSTSMVSEDSRIFWHCFCYYKGDYKVEPMYYPVSMDVCMDEKMTTTAKSLYKQQRRWGWGVENIPYLVFNTIKQWKNIPKKKFLSRIFVQAYGFHSWATNALIIAVIGWMPLLLGGEKFHDTVLSTNLPFVARTLMTIAMTGLVLSAILSTMLLPKNPKKSILSKYIVMLGQWIVLPISIIIFGAIPGLEAQTRLMFGKYLGFWVTPKKR